MDVRVYILAYAPNASVIRIDLLDRIIAIISFEMNNYLVQRRFCVVGVPSQGANRNLVPDTFIEINHLELQSLQKLRNWLHISTRKW